MINTENKDKEDTGTKSQYQKYLDIQKHEDQDQNILHFQQCWAFF